MDQSTLLFTRLLAVVYGGLFSYSMIELVWTGRLKYYLADQKFELLVISGGILLGLVVLLKLRAMQSGMGHTHAHDHDHGHDHSHDDHEHSVSLWRFIVLTFPLLILFAGLAPPGLSADILDTRMTKEQREAIAQASSLPEARWKWYVDMQDQLTQIAEKLTSADPQTKQQLQQQKSMLEEKIQQRIVVANAKELMEAARSSTSREYWESTQDPKFVRLSGQFQPDSRFTDRYRLSRIRIVCCAADATPITATVIGNVDPNWKYGDWLEVVGPVSFFGVEDTQKGQTTYYPAVQQILPAKKTEPKNYIQ